jgi:hypothetical protein
VSENEGTEQTGADEAVVDDRAELIQGLRELADFLEAAPDVPTPRWAAAHAPHYLRYGETVGARELAAVGGTVTVEDSDVIVKREFSGGVCLKVTAKAEDVCVEREVTKSEFVLPPELAPPAPAATLDEVAARR